MNRLALAVSLLVLPALAADPHLVRTLRGVEERYNHARTLQVQFLESYTVPGRLVRSESGVLTLRKPGRMRWDYTSPQGKLFVSDGKEVFLYTPQNKRVEKMALKESEDMRAPLAFLLGRLDFQKDFRDFSMRDLGGGTLLSASPKSDRLPYDRVEMTVDGEYRIRKLTITGQDRSILSFSFESEKVNPAVDDKQFKFQMPAGATLVNAAEDRR